MFFEILGVYWFRHLVEIKSACRG